MTSSIIVDIVQLLIWVSLLFLASMTSCIQIIVLLATIYCLRQLFLDWILDPINPTPVLFSHTQSYYTSVREALFGIDLDNDDDNDDNDEENSIICRPVSEKTILSLESFQIKSNDIRLQLDACVVCTNTLGKGERLLCLYPCMHIFHKICIIPWLKQSEQCPLCRGKVTMRPT